MTQEQKKIQSLMRMRNMKISMIIGYGVIVVAAIIGITLFAIRENENVLRSKVTSMTSTLDVQLKMNLDSYLERMESVGTLAFSVDDAYTYDACDPNNDEYEALNIEKNISNELKDLCLMENFVDYGIVYRNNRTVGKISNGTTQLFGSELFEGLEGMVKRERTHDGWSAGYGGDFERIYYVKRIHENALLLISFYTSELEHVFDNPETMSEMAIRLTDQNYRILYSSIPEELSLSLPSEISERVQGRDLSAVMDDTYLTTVNSCNVGWYVICSVPTEIIMQEKNDMQKYIYIAAAIAAAVATLAGAIFSIRMADPVANVVSSIDGGIREDGFPDVLASRFFREKADSILSNIKEKDKNNRSIVIVDIDDFMDITCSVGRDFSMKLVSKAVESIKATFKDTECIGRVGESTFCLLTMPSGQTGSSYKNLINKKCMDLCNSFRDEYTAADGYEYKLTLSIGVASFPQNGRDLSSIYDCAYKALYVSQARGQDTFTVYDEKV